MGEKKDNKTQRGKGSGKRLTPREYRTACQMWESGEYTLKNIAEHFGILPNGLSVRFRKDGIVKGAQAEKHDKAVAASIEKDTARSAMETRKLVSELQKNNLTWLDQITKRTLLIAAQASKENMPLGMFKDDVKVLKDMSDIISKNYGTAAQILRIDEIAEAQEDLPTFSVHEMTAEDVEAIRQNQREQLEEFTIKPSQESEDDDDIVELS